MSKIKPNERAKEIIPVHLYGQIAEMDPLMELVKDNDLKIIEDAAQMHEAEYKGRKSGTIGDTGGFSFYPGKNLGDYGDAGMTTTNDDEIAKKAQILRNLGYNIGGAE